MGLKAYALVTQDVHRQTVHMYVIAGSKGPNTKKGHKALFCVKVKPCDTVKDRADLLRVAEAQALNRARQKGLKIATQVRHQ